MKHLVAAAVVLAGVGVAFSRCAQGEFISGIERRNSTNAAPAIAGAALGENSTSFVDRTYEYVNVPGEILGAQYVKVANDDKRVVDYELDVMLAWEATLLLFIDNRTGNDGLGEHPADYAGITPDLSSEMTWAADMGFEDMGVDIGVDESGNGVANYWSSVYRKEFEAGTITLLEQKLYDGGRNMYGVAAIAVSRPAKIIYVDDGAAATGSGLSWDSAFRCLQNALADAESGDEIRVGQGVYRPDLEQVCGRFGCEGEPNASGDREATFQLKNGVTIKGGYAGLGQPDPNARDIEFYETILSGDLNGDDGPDFANNSENSCSVVTSSYTDSSTVIDGFTISGGNADDSGGPEYSHPGSNGAGMFNSHGNPIVSHCTFRGNRARLHGAGIANVYYGRPKVTYCTFTRNQAAEGGAVANWLADGFSFESCVFSGNVAGGVGGGMEVGNSIDGIVRNCTFAGNRALGEGSGMFVWANSEATVRNCIFLDGGDEIAHDGSSAITVTYSDVSGIVAGEGNFDADPCFADDGHWDENGTPEDANDDFWVDGDYHLKSEAGRWDPIAGVWVKDTVTSLCIDAGNPDSDWTGELWPHGKRINVGAYGGSAEASMSLLDVGTRANVDNRDCVDFNDVLLLAKRWCVEAPLLAEDLDRDGRVDGKDFAVFAKDWRFGLRPDPMAWATAPYGISSSTISMTAATATACDGGDVEYYFEDYNEPGHNSGWLSFGPGEQAAWEDPCLLPDQEYCYRAKARNASSLFETGWSDVLCARAFGTGWPLVFQADFEDESLDSWEATDPSAWRIEDGHGGKVLSLFKGSSYSPPYRSPYNINLVRDVVVDNFVLELELLSTNSDYAHRDLCLFFGYQDESHFYYVHLGKTADATANSVFIVDNADRISIADYRTDGIPWDYEWHTVRVFRDVATGDIEVYFDDMIEPVMTAVNSRFLWGRVGVGSFDDIGQFDDVELRGQLWMAGDF